MCAEFSFRFPPFHYDILMMFYDYVIHLYLYALTDNDVTGRLFPLELNEISNSPFHERHLISMFAYLIEFYIVSFCNN